MNRKKYHYVYGPVSSWRLGRSLGIDLVSPRKGKVCDFDCIYCQLGKTNVFTAKRRIFVPTLKILEEIKALPPLDIDYITFSGQGEPTLAKNLGEVVRKIRKIMKATEGKLAPAGCPERKRGKRVAILTNSSIIDRKDVRKDLALADFVIAKLEAHNEKLFKKINGPAKGIKFDNIIKGLKKFKASYKGKFALQIMFVKENQNYAKEIAKLAKNINPDEIQINTPLRPCGLKPLSASELKKIKRYFKSINCVNVYSAKKKDVKPICKATTMKRRMRYDV